MRKKIQKKNKKHDCLTEEGFEEEGKKKKVTLFRHSSSTCDALRGPTELIYGCRCTSLMKDLLVRRFGEAAGLRKPKLFRGHGATAERGLTPVPETPPGCQVDLFFRRGSLTKQDPPGQNLAFRETFFCKAFLK